jgi:LAO/AO transport system kinase
MPGVNLAGKMPPRKRKILDVDEYVQGVLKGDRTVLAKAITLIESNHPEHQKLAGKLMREMMPHTGKSQRIGITGVPGAGKSTLIEALGTFLCQKGHHVAVLAVDPSSSRSGGSILGDKTRMEQLAREQNAFIRPSPSGGNLGGVARKSRETLYLCEAAGFDVILVETVGVGQSEISVRGMVDFFMLVQIAGAGDELQGIKKGVIEMADAIVVNKADGDNVRRAEGARQEYERILHFLQPATPEWSSPALCVSSLNGMGIDKLWETVGRFFANVKESGHHHQRRQEQTMSWVRNLIEEDLLRQFYTHPEVSQNWDTVRKKVISGQLPAPQAALELLSRFAGV